MDSEVVVDDLKKALLKIDDRGAALRLLGWMHPDVEVIKPLLAKVLGPAIDSTDLTTIQLAREALANYKDEPWVKNNIPLLVPRYLPDHDDWNYRRIAELYELLAYKEDLTNFLLLCETSTNADFREISDDFRTQ